MSLVVDLVLATDVGVGVAKIQKVLLCPSRRDLSPRIAAAIRHSLAKISGCSNPSSTSTYAVFKKQVPTPD